jgi:hypothetical protein
MEAKRFFKASQFFACVTLACMALTLLSSFGVYSVNLDGPSQAVSGPGPSLDVGPPVMAPAAKMARRSRKAHRARSRKAEEPKPSSVWSPVSAPVKSEEPVYPVRWIAFIVTLISAACGIISMMLGLRADRRATKKEAVIDGDERARRTPSA